MLKIYFKTTPNMYQRAEALGYSVLNPMKQSPDRSTLSRYCFKLDNIMHGSAPDAAFNHRSLHCAGHFSIF